MAENTVILLSGAPNDQPGERVVKDEIKKNLYVQNTLHFHKQALMSEIVHKYFSRRAVLTSRMIILCKHLVMSVCSYIVFVMVSTMAKE